MKKIIISIFSVLFIVNTTSMTAKAAGATPSSIELLKHGYYIETYIENTEDTASFLPMATMQYITKTKTSQLKNELGIVVCSVSIKATFAYDGITSTCTSCSPSATSSSSNYTVKSVTSSRSGNSATAKAIITIKYVAGITRDITESVTIQCSASGVVS